MIWYKNKRKGVSVEGTEQNKPKIEYPCPWQYRLIGEDADAMRKALSSAVDVGRCIVSEKNRSASGKYVSMEVELIVQNEEERQALYQFLAEHPAIRMVL